MTRIINKIKNAALGSPNGERAKAVRRVPDEQIIAAFKTVDAQGNFDRGDSRWFPDAFADKGKD